MNACHCKDYTRAAILRQTAARAGAGAGLRAIEPGMPLPAGTGLSRRSFLARSSGLALAVFGGGALAPRAFEEGIADAMGAAREQTVLVSIFLVGRARHARRCSPRSTTPPTSRCARRSSWRRTRRIAFRDDTRLQWHPAARAAQGAARGGPAHGDPGDRLLHPEPVALHVAPLLRGRRAQRGGADRLARPLAGPQRPRRTTRSRASRSTRRSRPRSRRRACPSPRSPSPTNFALSTDGVGTAVRASMNQTYGAIGRLSTSDPHARRRRAAPPPRWSGSRRAWPAVRQGDHRHAGRRDRTRPTAASRTSCARWRRCSHMGLPIRCVALDGNGGYDTHDNQAATLTEQPRRSSPPRCRRSRPTSRDGSRRAARRSPTACSCTCGASSAAAPPRTARARTTARRARPC